MITISTSSMSSMKANRSIVSNYPASTPIPIPLGRAARRATPKTLGGTPNSVLKGLGGSSTPKKPIHPSSHASDEKKADRMVLLQREFFHKTLQIVLNGVVATPASAASKRNKWFQVSTREIPECRERLDRLFPGKLSDFPSDSEIVIDVYWSSSPASGLKSLVDAQPQSKHDKLGKPDKPGVHQHEDQPCVLERWALSFKRLGEPSELKPSTVAALYVRLSLFVRSFMSFMILMPRSEAYPSGSGASYSNADYLSWKIMSSTRESSLMFRESPRSHTFPTVRNEAAQVSCQVFFVASIPMPRTVSAKNSLAMEKDMGKAKDKDKDGHTSSVNAHADRKSMTVPPKNASSAESALKLSASKSAMSPSSPILAAALYEDYVDRPYPAAGSSAARGSILKDGAAALSCSPASPFMGSFSKGSLASEPDVASPPGVPSTFLLAATSPRWEATIDVTTQQPDADDMYLGNGAARGGGERDYDAELGLFLESFSQTTYVRLLQPKPPVALSEFLRSVELQLSSWAASRPDQEM